MTKLNEQILKMVEEYDGHLNAEQAFFLAKEKGIDISMASTYRILSKLAEEGYLKKVTLPGKPDLFDKTTRMHAHLICDVCGCISDYDIPGLQKILKDQTGMNVENYDLLIHYICEECKKKEEKCEQ